MITPEQFVINQKDRINGVPPTPAQVYKWMLDYAKEMCDLQRQSDASVDTPYFGNEGIKTMAMMRDSILNNPNVCNQ